MPGPVSDSYDPEFSTGERATRVREGIMQQRDRLTAILGDKLLNIVKVVDDEFESTVPIHNMFALGEKLVTPIYFTERELRILRFALNRAIDTI